MRVSPLIAFHIVAGTGAVLSGGVAIVVRKGSRLHAVTGTVFAFCMLGMSASGAGMGLWQHLAMMKGQLMNVFNGVLTFYLVATGWAAARSHTRKMRAFVACALAVALADGIAMMSFGTKAAHSATRSIDGYPAGIYFFFGSVTLLAAAGDIRELLATSVSGVQRIVRHLWRMSFALLIATASFFLGQQKTFPVAWRGAKIWYAPPLTVLLLMAFWLIRVPFLKLYRVAGAGRRVPEAIPIQGHSSLQQPTESAAPESA